MIVQVGALGHALEEGTEGKRVRANGAELLCGAKFGSRLLGPHGLGRDLHRQAGCGEKHENDKCHMTGAWHACDSRSAHCSPQ